MAGSDRPPEQLIRDWLEEHGSVTVGLAALRHTWRMERIGARERREITRALASAGVTVEPPLSEVGDPDTVALSLSPSDQVSGVRSQAPARLGLVATAVVLMVVGSLGPWAKDVFVTDYGLDRDGALVIAAAALAAVVLVLHARRGRPAGLPVLAAGLGALAIGILASQFRDLLDDSFVDPAWGLYVAAAGAFLLVALSMSLLVRRD